jgi:hypothetical protein
VQIGCDFLNHGVIPFLKKRTYFQSRNLQAQFLYACIACLVASTVIITFYFKQHDFLRNFGEFPLKQENYAKLNKYLQENMQSEDIIITNGKGSNYFIYNEYIKTNHKPQIYFLSWYLRKIVWNEFDCFYVSRWKFEKMAILLNVLKGMNHHVDLNKISKVWLVNIGWDADEIGTFLSAQPSYIPLIHKELSVEGGYIYSVKTESIVQNLIGKKEL